MNQLDNWLVYAPQAGDTPQQGWKVHVSACLDNADRILDVVWDFCVAHAIPFKFQRSHAALLLANAKYAHRGGSGKFITIYPRNNSELEQVLVSLDAQLHGEPGPYILSDLRWADGPLFVRYGGFSPRYCLDATGALVPAIENPSGQLVPDRREPTFRYPEWVELPDFLAPHLAARSQVRVDSIPYQVERPLHFSNSGGVYLGRDTRTGNAVVLKESRPHAGLDMRGADAVERSRREETNLRRLAGLDAIPALLDTFTLGDHRFLVQEYVEGEPLQSQIVERNPLVRLTFDPGEAAAYVNWVLEVVERTEQAVAAAHERGVVIGDLHPGNILIRPDGRIVLIDFEAAASLDEDYRPAMADPAFAMPEPLSGFDIDEYALACLRLYLFMPLTSLLGLDRAKAEDIAAGIRESFDVPAPFLDHAVEVIGGGTERNSQPRKRSVLETPDHTGWESIRSSMAQAILASATPERDDRLFPGDVAQFETGGLNIAHGAAGVLYALAITGAGRYPEYEEWLVRRAAEPARDTLRLGFYDGLHGVAHVLELLGHRAEARKIVDICSEELAGREDRLGLDLYGGLSGIALNLLHMAESTRDPSLSTSALTVAQAVADRLGGAEDVAEISGGNHPYAGLMYGSSGPALLFLHLYERTGREQLLDLAATALRQDLRRCTSRGDGGLEVNEGWRTMPYLADGSVGIGVILERYLRHRADEEFGAALRAIRRTANARFYIEPGLFDGRAGMILFLATSGEEEHVATHIRRLSWHAMSYGGGLAFPGAELMRLSMDLATGTAGVLLAVGAALHTEPVGLPFLVPSRSGGPVAESNRSTARAERR